VPVALVRVLVLAPVDRAELEDAEPAGAGAARLGRRVAAEARGARLGRRRRRRRRRGLLLREGVGRQGLWLLLHLLGAGVRLRRAGDEGEEDGGAALRRRRLGGGGAHFVCVCVGWV